MDETRRKYQGHVYKTSQKNKISKKTPQKLKMTNLGTTKTKMALKWLKMDRLGLITLYFFGGGL